MLSRKEIGNRIDSAIGFRNASGIARRLGIRPSTLSNYRTGLRMPSAAFIHALAVDLGVSADVVLGLGTPAVRDPSGKTGLIRRKILRKLYLAEAAIAKAREAAVEGG